MFSKFVKHSDCSSQKIETFSWLQTIKIKFSRNSWIRLDSRTKKANPWVMEIWIAHTKSKIYWFVSFKVLAQSQKTVRKSMKIMEYILKNENIPNFPQIIWDHLGISGSFQDTPTNDFELAWSLKITQSWKNQQIRERSGAESSALSILNLCSFSRFVFVLTRRAYFSQRKALWSNTRSEQS